MAWRVHLQNEMYWYNRYASRIVVKISSKQTPMSIAKWSMIIMSTSFLLVYHRVLYWVFCSFNLLKWHNKGYLINQQIICWWYLHFFYCKLHWCFWTLVEQWPEENTYLGLSVEDVLQSRCFTAGSRGDIL